LKKYGLIVAGILILALLTSARWIPGWYWALRTDNPIRRGASLAAREGCLSCHAPRGSQEFANPGSRWGTVPSFFRGNAMMYMKSPEEVAYFIAEGHAKAAAPLSAGKPDPPFHMKAFKERLTSKQIQDLAAFVLAADGFRVPSEGPVAKGSELSDKFGCESCHGVAGSGGVRNPRSVTGVVPGLTGADFNHLVSGPSEFREWVLDGRSARFRHDRAASFFLDRAILQMPSFKGVLKDSEVEDIWAYLLWLKSPQPSPINGNTEAPAPESHK
jgi:mono/diheme cytochrome c family protein